MDDVYKQVLEKDLIRVTKNGSVYRLDKNKNKFIKAQQISTGRDKKYKIVTIVIQGRQYHLYVHRLVAFMYIPNPQNKPTVNHIDGNPSNNNVKNLEWATHSEQIIKNAELRVFIEPTYPNLERYLIENEVDTKELAYWCNLTPATLEKRLRGETEWKLNEAIAIKEKLKIKEKLERLFLRSQEV